eukprot:310339-Chlamydomonas_euryale.AAC.1
MAPAMAAVGRSGAFPSATAAAVAAVAALAAWSPAFPYAAAAAAAVAATAVRPRAFPCADRCGCTAWLHAVRACAGTSCAASAAGRSTCPMAVRRARWSALGRMVCGEARGGQQRTSAHCVLSLWSGYSAAPVKLPLQAGQAGSGGCVTGRSLCRRGDWPSASVVAASGLAPLSLPAPPSRRCHAAVVPPAVRALRQRAVLRAGVSQAWATCTFVLWIRGCEAGRGALIYQRLLQAACPLAGPIGPLPRLLAPARCPSKQA